MRILLAFQVFVFTASLSLAQAPTSEYTEAVARCKVEGDFNQCIVATTSYLYSDRGKKGYADTVFTKHLDYGPSNAAIKASSPPTTMCVAAVAEVAIESLNFYYKATGDKVPFQVISADSWNKSRPIDIRSYIWENEGPGDSRGAGLAFKTFGMGEVIGFSQARPGDFISLDRSKFRPRVTWKADEIEKFSKKSPRVVDGQEGVWETSGHSTVFLGFLDKSLKPTLKFKDGQIVGFRYFSSQGSAAPNGGFGYKWAIFKGAKDSEGRNVCTIAKLSDPIDCSLGGIDKGSLRVGRLWHPSKWDAGKPGKLVVSLTKKIEESLEDLIALDSLFLSKKSTPPKSLLNVPEFKGATGESAPSAESNFVRARTMEILQEENPSFDFERFNGVTDPDE